MLGYWEINWLFKNFRSLFCWAICALIHQLPWYLRLPYAMTLHRDRCVVEFMIKDFASGEKLLLSSQNIFGLFDLRRNKAMLFADLSPSPHPTSPSSVVWSGKASNSLFRPSSVILGLWLTLTDWRFNTLFWWGISMASAITVASAGPKSALHRCRL